jgi:general secretion pathway protein K
MTPKPACSGFALLAVLWVVAALTVLSSAALAVARTGSDATRNRTVLARAGWAREACVEILLARFAQHGDIERADTIDLGRGTWCVAELENPAAKLNVNLADRDQLVRVLTEVGIRAAAIDSLVDALLDWRDADTITRPLGAETPANRNGPLADIAELRYVRGFGDTLTQRLSTYLTTRGTGAIDLTAAPRAVLMAVPGISEEMIVQLLARRGAVRSARSVDELAALLSPSARKTLYASYPEFVRATAFGPPQLLAIAEGGVHGTHLVARVTLTAIPTGSRLAIIRRETE